MNIIEPKSIQPVATLPNMAWQVKHIAEAIGFSESQVKRIIKEDPSFPKPRLISKTKTWKPSEVMDWYESQEVA